LILEKTHILFVVCSDIAPEDRVDHTSWWPRSVGAESHLLCSESLWNIRLVSHYQVSLHAKMISIVPDSQIIAHENGLRGLSIVLLVPS
jgi:hypothetical protein